MQNENELLALLDNSPVLTLLVDSAMRVRRANGMVEEFTHRSSEELIDTRGGEALRCLHAFEDPQGCGYGEFCRQCTMRKTINETFRTGDKCFRKEIALPFRDENQDRVLYFLLSCSPITMQNGKMVVVSLENITRLKMMEIELHNKLELLQNAQQQLIDQERYRALGEMASGIAHDFNNALNSIVGYSDLLLLPDGFNDIQEARRFVQTINKAGQDAAVIVRRLRKFYRTPDTEEMGPVDINAVIREALSLTEPRWKQKAQAESAPVKVELDLQQTPEVKGSEVEMREMLVNLVFNAVDAMPQGGTLIFRTSRDMDQVKLEVADSGIGMSAATRQRCMEPFFTTKGQEGTGMGLAVLQNILRRHQGGVQVESRPGRGSKFTITLPILKHMSTAASVEKKRVDAKPLRILVVDDDHSQRQLLDEMLVRNANYVDTAATGQEAIDRFKSDCYDLVITNRSMPDISGDKVGEAVKRMAPDKPVIMVTGFGDMMNATGATPEGIDLVVCKPVTSEIIQKALASVNLPTHN